MKHSWFLLSFILASMAAYAQESKGVVESVSGKTVKVRIISGSAPQVGDTVELSDEVPGVGPVALQGAWVVKSVEADRVTAEPQGAVAGAPQSGQRATIKTSRGVPTPQPVGPTPRPRPRKHDGPRDQSTQDLSRAVLQNEDPVPVRKLIQAGADVNDSSDGGYTLLMKAARTSSPAIVAALLDGGAEIDAQTTDAKTRDEIGHTALMEAADGGEIRNVKLLIERKANVHLQAKEGGTALMIAASNGRLEIVKVLLQAGARPDVKNREGKNAADLAESTGNTEVARFLREVPFGKSEAPAVPPARKGWIRQRPAKGGFSAELPPEYQPSATQFDSIAMLFETPRGDASSQLRVFRVRTSTLAEGETISDCRDRLIKEQRERFKDFSQVATGKARVAGSSAVTLTYIYSWEGQGVKSVVSFVSRGSVAYEISCVTLSSSFDDRAREFASIVETFVIE